MLGPYCSLEILAGLLTRSSLHVDDLEKMLSSLIDNGSLLSWAGQGADGTIRLFHPLIADIVLDSTPADRLSALRQHAAELFYSLIGYEGRDLAFATASMLSGAWLLKNEWAVDLLAGAGERLMLLENYDAAG